MISAARQLQDKGQKQSTYLFSTFVDLTKTFGIVCSEGLWKIIAKFTKEAHEYCKPPIHKHEHSFGLSQPFSGSNGIKQAYALAPILFTLMFSAMVSGPSREEKIGIGIEHYMGG